MCYWCGEDADGDTLFICDECEKGFCQECISFHLGKSELDNVLNSDPWHCSVCDSNPLLPFVNHFIKSQEKDYFPNDINDTRELLVEVENKRNELLIVMSEEDEELLVNFREKLRGVEEERSM